jgi:hypothetical protein
LTTYRHGKVRLDIPGFGGIMGLYANAYRHNEGRMSREHKTTVRLPENLHRRAKAKAVLEGRNFSEVYRMLFEMWTEGKIELPEPEQGAKSDED